MCVISYIMNRIYPYTRTNYRGEILTDRKKNKKKTKTIQNKERTVIF